MAYNKFSAIFFFENRPPAKYRTVTNLPKLWEFCNKNLGFVTSVNVYNKRTGDFVKQFRDYSSCFQLFKIR